MKGAVMRHKRFDMFFERHIGIGLRWELNWYYDVELSIALPFVTICVGLGKERR
jgi:hypothetical protein